MGGTLDQLHRLDGGQGNRDFGLLVARRPEVNLVGGHVGIYTHGDSNHFGPGRRGDADQLFVTAGVTQQADDVLVSHLDSQEAGNHNLGSASVPRYANGQI